MRNSHFSRVLLLAILMLACTLSLEAQKPGFTFNQTGRWNPLYPGDFEKALYRATLDVMNHHMTGMMLIKRTSDSSFRINFSNEVGMTFFDLEITDKEMKKIAVFPDMDRKSLLSMLEIDFRLLLFRDHTIKKMNTQDDCMKDSLMLHNAVSDWGKYTYTVHCWGLNLKSIASTKKGFTRAILDFQYLAAPVPSKVIIRNPSIRLNLRLSLLSN